MVWFDAYALISLWERDPALPSAAKAVTLCELACPGATREEIAAMTIGRRDRALLAMRARLFGEELAGMASCSACGEQLEVELGISDLCAEPAPDIVSGHTVAADDGLVMTFRLPTAGDAMAVIGHASREDARRALVRLCIISAARDDKGVEVSILGDDAVARVAQAIETIDPLSEIRLNLGCAACGHDDSVLLDIASYLWAELVGEAERLLGDVCFLARAYGWREADILSMSARRRHFYLDRRPS